MTFNAGTDILSSGDPFAKALEIFGRRVVANSLSKVLATQCSGVFGIFTSLMPQQTTVPILLKRISEDLEYLKTSLDQLR